MIDQIFKPCRCSNVRKAFDNFCEVLCDEIDGKGVKVTDETGKLVVGLDMACDLCGNTGKVLTDEGKLLVALLKPRVKGDAS